MVVWLHVLGQNIMAAGVHFGGSSSPHGVKEAERKRKGQGTRYHLSSDPFPPGRTQPPKVSTTSQNEGDKRSMHEPVEDTFYSNHDIPPRPSDAHGCLIMQNAFIPFPRVTEGLTVPTLFKGPASL
jgi:hypothetical protein